MGYFDKSALQFLDELARNNNREWFRENKERYELDVREPFLDFISDAGPRLDKLSNALVADPRPVGGSLFRIHRDVRFSKDNRVGVYIAPPSRRSATRLRAAGLGDYRGTDRERC